ncbi:13548_t:CDS:2, partial [Gigaspora rosea]
MSFLTFPECNGSCHPDAWVRNFKFVISFYRGAPSEQEAINIALLNISQIFDLKRLNQSILKILPIKLFTDTFSLKIAESQSINEVFINLQNFLFQYKRVVKYGSVITLRHIDTGKLLSSSLKRYTGGSKQYWAYAVDRRANDYESWTMPEVLNPPIPPVYGGNKGKGLPKYESKPGEAEKFLSIIGSNFKWPASMPDGYRRHVFWALADDVGRIEYDDIAAYNYLVFFDCLDKGEFETHKDEWVL